MQLCAMLNIASLLYAEENYSTGVLFSIFLHHIIAASAKAVRKMQTKNCFDCIYMFVIHFSMHCTAFFYVSKLISDMNGVKNE
jgi:hypothetical protein